MLTVEIDGKRCQAAEGQTVLEAAAHAGITIPTLCYHRDLSPVGSCRLCVVQVDDSEVYDAACTLEVTDGMVVRTETPELADSRRTILELLLQNYHDANYTAVGQPETEFNYWLQHYGVKGPGPQGTAARHAVDGDPNPFVWVDLNKCILCTRCVRACEEVQGRFVWGVGHRGHDARIIAGNDTTMLDAGCESCGACSAYCPTGALADRNAIAVGAVDKRVTTTCPYCGVGCQFDLHVAGNRITHVASNPTAPVNGMSLCVKGRYGHDFVHHADRLTKPQARRWVLDGQSWQGRPSDRGDWVEIGWDAAFELVADRFATTKEQSGPGAFGVLSSAKCSNEENYLMQKFARQVLGTHNVDHCARLCHSSTVAGLAMCFGSGAMSNSMQDVAECAEAIFIIGSNTTEQHPVFGANLRQAVLRRGVRIVVADPRRIDICEFAKLHLRQRPGTDVALLNGIMNVIIAQGWHDEPFIQERCEAFDAFRAVVEAYTPEVASQITGVPAEDLCRAAELLATNKPMAVIWSMGITQHTTGVMNVLSLGNLQMLLGNMGVAGGGVNPLRGQNNVQGACDMGALPNVFPGYQSVTNASSAAKFAAAWELEQGSESTRGNTVHADAGLFPIEPGLTVTEMLDAAADNRIRALYILGEDPVMTEPDSNHAKGCLAAAEFVVLQEILNSETAAYADVLLPGACFAEKEGTFTNTERRIQAIREAVTPPGEATPDWKITSQLAQWTLGKMNRAPCGAFADWRYRDTAEILGEISNVTPSYAGVSYDRLHRGDCLQWPVDSADHPGTPILHVGRFTRGKGKFHAAEHLDASELPDSDYPLLLTTGRVLYHWHGGELTRRSPALLEAFPESVVEISPDDALKFGIADGGHVQVKSRRGNMASKAVVTHRVSPGVVFANFHFPGSGNANNLTNRALDPIAKIPEYKVCAVHIQPGC